MQALIYTADEWADAQPADQQTVVDWINTLDLPPGRISNLLHHAGRITAEYTWIEHSIWHGPIICCDVRTCPCSEPPPEFYTVSRRIDPTPAETYDPLDVLADMADAWWALSWRMAIEAGRRVWAWLS